MNLIEIQKTQIDGEVVNAVNSREIYEYLELVKGQYSRWIKSAIDKYDFVENEDYICFDMDVEGVKAKTYIVTLDMAKELCMVSNTKKGKETRKYFIEVEKQTNKPMSIEDMIIAQATSVKELKGRLEAIETRQREAEKALLDIEPANTPSPTKPLRGRINEIVRMYCATNSVPFNNAWKKLYQEVYYRCHVDLKRRAINGKSKLDVADELDILPDLYSIASEIFIKKIA